MAAFDGGIFGRAAVADALRRNQGSTFSPGGGGGTVPGGAMGGFQAAPQPSVQRDQSQSNPISPQTANNLMKYMQGLRYGGGATAAAGEAAMPAMSAGGGSSLGSMGLMQAPVSFPGAAAGGGGGGAAGGAGFGGFGAGGMLAGLAALSHLTDKEMNESESSIINADKLNDMGSVNGIGLRAGDLANGFNPATWLSDPKKAAKGLGNALTLGLMGKIF